MRKVVASLFLSLDGVAEQPDEYVTDMDDAMEENLGRGIATQDAVLLGRRTYDDWAGFWPDSAIEPFASFINGVQKFVVTRRRSNASGRRPLSSRAAWQTSLLSLSSSTAATSGFTGAFR